MSSPSPEQQSAARAMKHFKLNKSPKPGKINRHAATLARRAVLSHRFAVWQLRQLRQQLGFNISNTGLFLFLKAPQSTCGVTDAFRQISAESVRLPHSSHAEELGASNSIQAEFFIKTIHQIVTLFKQLINTTKHLGSTRCGGSSGGQATGGGSAPSCTLNTCSGCDPPLLTLEQSTHQHTTSQTLLHAFSKKVGSSLNGAKKMLLLGGIAALAHGAVPNVYGSAITPSFAQSGDQSQTTIYLQNNDTSVTYDSGELKYDELLIGVAQSVQANNSDYSTNSLSEIMGEWGVQIRAPPTGEVETGWSTSLSSGILDLTHDSGIPNLDYTEWNNTTDNSDSDEIALLVNFYDQLDFNHNGLIDDNERLTQTSTYVDKAFKGYDVSNVEFGSGTNAIGVVPEPTALSLIGVIGAGLIAARRIFGMYYKR